MKVLNFFYENHPKFEVSYERKNQISKPNIIIKGPRFCGKKILIFNFLSQFKCKGYFKKEHVTILNNFSKNPK